MSNRVLDEKYILERQLAHGGMGEIWVAQDARLRRRVAVKLMRPELAASPEACRRFEREAMSIAQFQNPSVVQVFDYGIDEQPYIVMELLEGEDLDQRLGRERRLSLAATIALVTQVAQALEAAHAAGIVHRDLKPLNIYFARSAAGEGVKVLDFGVAAMLREPDGAGRRPGVLLGTPSYMSPEQVCGGDHVDHRGDLWSLAVIAYEALTGTLPFAAPSLGDLIVRICLDPLVPPTHLAPDLVPALDAFFERALCKDRERRFQSAQELAGAMASLGESSEGPVKILIVDDEPDAAVLIRQRFRQQIRSGLYDFVSVADGLEAMDELRRHPEIDVALVDINMPGMDGLTLLSRVGEVNPILKVIIVSAYSDMSNLRTAMNRGAFDFLVKPVDWKDLEITLNKTIEHVRMLRKGVRFTEENTLLRLLVNHGVVDRLLPMLRAADTFASEAIEATVCAVEVRGLCAIEKPDELVRLLNQCFEQIVPEVTARKGTVDKFTGAAVMAVFRGSDHRERALDAMLASRARLQALGQREEPQRAVGLCAGIQSGEVVAGGIGSRALGHLDYTVVGEVVSAAARLGAAAASDQILLGGSVDEALRGAFELQPLPDGVYSVVGRLAPATEATVER